MSRPPNFSWVVPGLLAGLGFPRQPPHLEYLKDNGIKYLVSLSESLPRGLRDHPELVSHQISIVDFHPPTMRQLDRFIELVDEAEQNGEALAVHCHIGCGRTGTMLACYLMAKDTSLTGDGAIDEIRRRRPGSIETRDQEQAVRDYYQELLKRRQ